MIIPFCAAVVRPCAWSLELPMQERTWSEWDDFQGGEGTGARTLWRETTGMGHVQPEEKASGRPSIRLPVSTRRS